MNPVALHELASALPAGAAVPVPREWLLDLLANVAREAPPEAVDRLLTVEEVAERLGATPKYVYRQAGRWPFRRKLGGRTLRFSERGLARWLERARS
jgi:excisionase family DNA binding protein